MESDIRQNPWVVAQFEKYFYWHGKLIAKKPWLFILISLLLCGISSIGLLKYKTESNPYKLWIPPDSDFVRNTDWLWSNFPPDSRFHSVIITADNVLRPDVLDHVFNVHKTIENVQSPEGRRWNKHCYKIPVVDLRGEDVSEKVEDDGTLLSFEDDIDTADYSDYYDYFNIEQKRRKRSLSTSGDSDPSVELYPQDYCNIVNEVTKPKCLQYSIAELFANEDFINGPKNLQNLTSQDIINKVNNEEYSNVFLFNKNFTTYLGGIERNETGHIVGAKATIVQFFGHINLTAITEADQKKNTFGAPVDEGTLEFEHALLQSLLQMINETQTKDTKTYVNIARAFNDLSDEAIGTDVSRLVGGISIVYMYVLFMLGGFDCVNQKPLLGFIGLSSVFFAVMASYGICSAMGLLFSPMHNIVPFLLLGIGIDDMFVIVQCLSNLEQKDRKWLENPIDELIGETMRHAGVAITITSLTDFIVFMVGASTVLPALYSFCIYCGVGVMIVYILQATYFVSFLTFEIKRTRANRNSFLPCIKHDCNSRSEDNDMKNNPGKAFFKKFGTYLMHPVTKGFVLVLTCGLTGLGAYGVTELKQEFNPAWFLPPGSYLNQWIDQKESYFPNKGERVTINIGEIDYENELWKVEALIEALEKETDIVTNVDSWLGQFRQYVTDNQIIQGYFDATKLSDIEFFYRLTQFLYSPTGSKYRKNFHFGSNLVCGLNSPPIKLSTIEFTHKLFSGPSEHLPAMNRIKDLVASFNFSSTAFAVGNDYAGWETDEIIAYETFRNLGFSLLCVFVVTALLLVQPKSCLLVFTCVALTLIDVMGYMHFWGLTIDVVSCVTLVISVGLSIDYSAHVAHTFLVNPEENRNQRAIETLADIGSAVMNGGFSTFLAFVITSTSASHVFLTFFKIFTLVVTFGLYHGLVFLPVILSIVPDFKTSKKNVDKNDGNVNEGYA